jgi:hypothetical protein
MSLLLLFRSSAAAGGDVSLSAGVNAIGRVVQAPLSVEVPARSAAAAVGRLTAPLQTDANLGQTGLAGVGALSGVAAVEAPAGSAPAGIGLITFARLSVVDNTFVSLLPAELRGVGLLVVPLQADAVAGAALQGVGRLTAPLAVEASTRAALQGVGRLTGGPSVEVPGGGGMAGVGRLSVPLQADAVMRSAPAGIGLIGFARVTLIDNTFVQLVPAALQGVGLLSAPLLVEAPARSAAAAVGRIVVPLQADAIASPRAMAAVSRLTAAQPQVEALLAGAPAGVARPTPELGVLAHLGGQPRGVGRLTPVLVVLDPSVPLFPDPFISNPRFALDRSVRAFVLDGNPRFALDRSVRVFVLDDSGRVLVLDPSLGLFRLE